MSRSRRDRTRFRPATRWRHAVPPGSLDQLGDIEYIRFAGTEVDSSSLQREGVFQLAIRMRDSASSPEVLRADVAASLLWFNRHLAQPRRFSHHRHGFRRSAHGDWVREPIAISWFKPEASVHLVRIRALVAILRSGALVVHELRTRRPGYITYEDQAQIVAVPFSAQDIAMLGLPAS